jgi:hypothetical protein
MLGQLEGIGEETVVTYLQVRSTAPEFGLTE